MYRQLEEIKYFNIDNNNLYYWLDRLNYFTRRIDQKGSNFFNCEARSLDIPISKDKLELYSYRGKSVDLFIREGLKTGTYIGMDKEPYFIYTDDEPFTFTYKGVTYSAHPDMIIIGKNYVRIIDIKNKENTNIKNVKPEGYEMQLFYYGGIITQYIKQVLGIYECISPAADPTGFIQVFYSGNKKLEKAIRTYLSYSDKFNTMVSFELKFIMNPENIMKEKAFIHTVKSNSWSLMYIDSEFHNWLKYNHSEPNENINKEVIPYKKEIRQKVSYLNSCINCKYFIKENKTCKVGIEVLEFTKEPLTPFWQD